MCIGFLLAFQIYIIVAAHSTDYILNARNDLDNLWANYTLNEDRISSIEISVNIHINQYLPEDISTDFSNFYSESLLWAK